MDQLHILRLQRNLEDIHRRCQRPQVDTKRDPIQCLETINPGADKAHGRVHHQLIGQISVALPIGRGWLSLAHAVDPGPHPGVRQERLSIGLQAKKLIQGL